MTYYDSDKARLAAFMAAIREYKPAESYPTHCTCGAALEVLWPKDRTMTSEPMLFCAPCHERENERDYQQE